MFRTILIYTYIFNIQHYDQYLSAWRPDNTWALCDVWWWCAVFAQQQQFTSRGDITTCSPCPLSWFWCPPSSPSWPRWRLSMPQESPRPGQEVHNSDSYKGSSILHREQPQASLHRTCINPLSLVFITVLRNSNYKSVSGEVCWWSHCARVQMLRLSIKQSA